MNLDPITKISGLKRKVDSMRKKKSRETIKMRNNSDSQNQERSPFVELATNQSHREDEETGVEFQISHLMIL
jgi:hypothetical protein